MAAVYPGPQNVFVRAHEHSNKMVIDFARNIKKFAVNRYTQVVPTEKVGGYFLEMTIEEAGRIISSDLRNFMWFDGAPAPEGVDGRESFEYKPFSTIRYAYPFFLGDLTINQASWNILDQHSSWTNLLYNCDKATPQFRPNILVPIPSKRSNFVFSCSLSDVFGHRWRMVS